jgi:hypothetical protein
MLRLPHYLYSWLTDGSQVVTLHACQCEKERVPTADMRERASGVCKWSRRNLMKWHHWRAQRQMEIAFVMCSPMCSSLPDVVGMKCKTVIIHSMADQCT